VTQTTTSLSAWLLLPLALVQGLLLALLHGAVNEHFLVWSDPRLLLSAYAAVLAFPVTACVLVDRVTPIAAWTRSLGVAAVAASCAGYVGWQLLPVGGEACADGQSVALLAWSLVCAVFIALPFLVVGWRGATSRNGYVRLHAEAWSNLASLLVAVVATVLAWALVMLFFMLVWAIGIRWPAHWSFEPWFVYPFSCVSFALALMLGRFETLPMRAVRRVLMLVMRWMAPLAYVALLLFVVTLAASGVGQLWKTSFAAGLLLSFGMALVLLVNAVWRDLEVEPALAVPLVWLQRLTLLCAPLLPALALWAFWLRVDQHGLTERRALGLIACVALAICTLGYALAELRPAGEPRLAWRRRVNVGIAGMLVATAVLVHSPVLDLKRIAAASQARRLNSGSNNDDLSYLRFDAGRYGLMELGRIAAGGDPSSAAKAVEALAKPNPGGLFSIKQDPPFTGPTREGYGQHFEVLPVGKNLPSVLVDQWFSNFPRRDWMSPCHGTVDAKQTDCIALLIDLNLDGRDEVVVFDGDRCCEESGIWSEVTPAGDWQQVGLLANGGKAGKLTMEALRDGRFAVGAVQRFRGLVVGEDPHDFVPVNR